MKDILTPKIRIKRQDSPYSFNRLLLVPPGKDRCQVIYHLLTTGITIERGGMPARYDENPGIFQLLSHTELETISVKPTIKRSINPLVFDLVNNMVNLTKEITKLAEIGARYEAFIDHIEGTRYSPSHLRVESPFQESSNMIKESFEEQLGLSMDDFDIG